MCNLNVDVDVVMIVVDDFWLVYQKIDHLNIALKKPTFLMGPYLYPPKKPTFLMGPYLSDPMCQNTDFLPTQLHRLA